MCIRDRLGKEAAHKVSPEDDRIYLFRPPFYTVDENAKSNPNFWLKSLTNVGEIDYERSVEIADFGLGSDSSIILNYEVSMEPRVMYLKWSFENGIESNSWVCTHETFEHFARDVGLESRKEA